jgi:outer membrane protein assembly factor BamB
MGTSDEKRLEGKRLSILPDRQVLAAEPALKDAPISLPAPENNSAWYQGQAVSDDGYGVVRHALLRGNLSKQETFSYASAPDEDVRLTSTPVVVGNLLVLLDGQGELSAHALNDLDKKIWQADLQKLTKEELPASGRESGFSRLLGEGKEDFIGGNISFVEGYIVATTGNGHVFAFELATGKLLWHRAMGISIQSVPSGRNGMIYFVTSDNQLYALSLRDGTTQWTSNGVPQQTKILGAPAPLPLSELVLVPYSSGELVALKQVNGFKLWEENMDTDLRIGALGFRFSDIMAAPVSYGGRVFISAEGHLVALDVRTGNRLWQLPVTLSSTPWVAGDWLFGMTNKQELVAIQVTDGKIRWVTPLPQYVKPEEKKERISWSGPVLANGQLIVVGSKGQLKTFGFENGDAKATHEIPDNVLLPPIVAGGKLFLLSNEAELVVVE